MASLEVSCDTSNKSINKVERNEVDPSDILKKLRNTNINRLVTAHLNINHVLGKFDQLEQIIQDNIDILILSETKLDKTFSSNMFNIDGYSLPFRRDRDKNGGGVLVDVKEGIPCRELKTSPGTANIEGIFLEINFRKSKWLLFAVYNNCKSNIGPFQQSVGPTIDLHMCKLEIFILIGDFNSEIHENAMKEFCEMYNLKNLITEPTCFKNLLNPSSIDVILTNRKNCFQDTRTLECGLSDHHKMIITVLKTCTPNRAVH